MSKNAVKGLGFLKRCKKFFTAADISTIYTAYIWSKLEYNSHVWVEAVKSYSEVLDRTQRKAQVFMNDKSVANTPDIVEHRCNVGCMVLIYRYIQDKLFTEIKQIYRSVKCFTRTTRLSQCSQSLVLELPANRRTHYRNSFFFNYTAFLWNNLPVAVFPTVPDIYTINLAGTI